jgi:hypothetical protein
LSGETATEFLGEVEFVAEKNALVKNLANLGVPLNELDPFGPV